MSSASLFAQAASGVKDATSSLQDLAALCANAEEVTSPGSPVITGAGAAAGESATLPSRALRSHRSVCLQSYGMSVPGTGVGIPAHNHSNAEPCHRSPIAVRLRTRPARALHFTVNKALTLRHICIAVRLSDAEMAAMDTSPADGLSVARTSLNSCATTTRGTGRRKRVRAKSNGVILVLPLRSWTHYGMGSNDCRCPDPPLGGLQAPLSLLLPSAASLSNALLSTIDHGSKADGVFDICCRRSGRLCPGHFAAGGRCGYQPRARVAGRQQQQRRHHGSGGKPHDMQASSESSKPSFKVLSTGA